MLQKKEIEVLRTLAQKYMAYATLPIQQEKRDLWYALNRRKMQKPMVLIDQMPWNELMDASLVCQVDHPYWRCVEWGMRTEIYKWEHLPVDMVLTPYIRLPRPLSDTGYGLRYEKEILNEHDRSVDAQRYTDTLSTEEEVALIRPAEVTLDREAEKEILDTAARVFEGIAPFRMVGLSMHLGMWDWIAQARSVTNCYFDLMDRPEFVHSIMEALTNAVLTTIDRYNAVGGFDTTSTLCHCSHTFSDDLPIGDVSGQGTSQQAWAFGMAQLFSSVSPEVTEEFEVAYMKRIFAKFGAVYYGCCDRLDDRLEIIDTLPNVRKISCSPWSNREAFAANLPHKYVMSNKPSPAFLATGTFDEQAVREDLRRTMRAARAHDVPLEMILKDISTVNDDPARLWRWAEIAAEETADFS